MGEVGGSPQMNKFEQVSSDHHQLSLAGGRVVGVPGLMSGGGESRVPGLMSGGRVGSPGLMTAGGGGFCLVTSNAWWVMDREVTISLWTEWLTDRHDWKYYLPWRAVTSVFRGSTCIQFYRHSWKIHSCQGRLQFETLYCVPWSIYSVSGSRATHTPTQCRCFSFFLRFQILRKVGQHDPHCELEHCEIGEAGLILSNLESTFDLFCCTVSSSLNPCST